MVLVLIVVDLVVLGRGEASSQTRHNFLFVLFLLALARCFGVWIGHVEGHQTGLEFAAGYLIELSMSIDNLFVFLLMFRSFGLSPELQRKALLLGILGAIVMRGLFIFAGIALLERFAWIQYFFGALLVVAALRLLRGKKHRRYAHSSQMDYAMDQALAQQPQGDLPLRGDRHRAGRSGIRD